jgi:hypothetical protein
MTDDEVAELGLLRLASEKGKFAVSIRRNMSQADQDALERLQLREWIKLIDVTPIWLSEGRGDLFRIFMLTPPALAFLRKHAS